jgi:4-amino-4-deoxy-L-arabinose transferase-like glycosyltransferase
MQHPLWPSSAALRAPKPQAVLAYIVLTFVAFLPRVFGLGRFVTSDEANFWLRRSAAFLDAMQSGNYAAMPLTSHPGVTTMWLGSIGILLERRLEQIGLLGGSGFATRLALLQAPVALTHVAGVVLAYWLLQRLLPGRFAFFGALLWAADPFVIAFDRLLHVDGLAGTFSTLCVLCACIYWHHDRRWRWLLGAGVSAALALLSKSPALALVPVVGLVALLSAFDEGRRTKDENTVASEQTFVFDLSSLVGPLAIWLLITAATVFALWPSLWVVPLQAFDALRFGVVSEGAEPHMLGNYFLGQENDAPGALFYPVATVLRLTPWTLLGLLMLPWAWRSARNAERRDLAALASFVVLFIIALSPFPKKFNRYLVPIFPALDVLAAYSLVRGADLLASLSQRFVLRLSLSRRVAALLLSVVGVAALLNVAMWHPYEIAAFNQALGGASAGAQTFTVGWGEGLEQVAAWLNEQPDITGVETASTQAVTLQPYLRPGAQALTPSNTLPEQAGYAVIYVRDAQNGWPGAPFDRFYRQRPIHTVRIAGVDYAWIYQVPPRVAHVRSAQFGLDLQLRGYTDIPLEPGQPLRMKLFWKVLGSPSVNYSLFAHLIGDDGQRYAQVDLPHLTSHWQADRYLTTELIVPLPASLKAGSYQLVIGWYDPATGQRLPLLASPRQRSASDGPDSLLLMDLPIDPANRGAKALIRGSTSTQ